MALRLLTAVSISLLGFFMSRNQSPRPVSTVVEERAVRTVNAAPRIVAPIALPGSLSTLPSIEHSGNVPDRSARLLDNWNLEGTILTREALAPFFAVSQPESIVLNMGESVSRIYPNRRERGDAQSDQTLYLSTAEGIEKVRRERAAQASSPPGAFFTAPWSFLPPGSHARRQLSANGYEVADFEAGLRDNKETIRPITSDLMSLLQGPDFDFHDVDPKDDAAMMGVLSRALSIGKEGQLALKMAENGFLVKEAGTDFTVFHTAFRIKNVKKAVFWQKFAKVGVSETLDEGSVHWLDCNPNDERLIKNCAGVVPRAEGGDQFDLSLFKQPGSARYIWFKDIGSNHNLPSKWPTEGFSLDAVVLEHAYAAK